MSYVPAFGLSLGSPLTLFSPLLASHHRRSHHLPPYSLRPSSSSPPLPPHQRKLTSDANWSTTTPFETSLGPLRGLFPLLSLRTCKADVCVGLAEGRAEELDQEDPKWRINGKYAVVSFVPRE